jgi:RNA polymerase sigma factor (sigma-70 family)
MADATLGVVLRRVRRLSGAAPDSGLSDGELLHAFLAARDQDAFAALVRRHGPLVLGVCRRVLHHQQDAEDAFQATFLVLARKAASVRRRAALASWLHGAAYRAALTLRRSLARRRHHEGRAGRPIETQAAGEAWREVEAILEEEIQRLPEKYRTAFVLCCLESQSRADVARRLGVAESTVSGRVDQARKLLRRRLARRGVTLSAALAASAVAQRAGAAVPPALLAATAKAAAAGVVPVSVAGVVEGILRAATVARLKAAAALALTLGALAGWAGMFAAPTVDPPAAADKAGPAPATQVDRHGDPLPDGAVARLGTMRFNHGEGLRQLHFSPDGKTVYSEGGGWLRAWDAATGEERGRLASSKDLLDDFVVTPDGKRAVSLTQEFIVFHDVVRVWDLSQMKEIQKLRLPVKRNEMSLFRRNALSRDGRLAAVNLPTEMRIFDLTTGRELYKLAKGGKEIRDVVFAGTDRLVTADSKQTIDVWDARTGKPIRQFAHGGPVEVLTASDDGRWLATLEHHTLGIDRLLDKDVVHVWDLRTGTKKHALAARPKRWFSRVRFSPDGKGLVTSNYGTNTPELTVWDVQTGERLREIAGAEGNVLAVCADGSRVALGSNRFDLWEVKTGRLVFDDPSRHAWAGALAFSPRGDRVLLLGENALSTWETATGRRCDSLEVPRYNLHNPSSGISPDCRFALSFTGDWKKTEGTVWDVVRRQRLYTFTASRTASAFSPDSSLLATWETGTESVIRLREVSTGHEIRSFPAGKVDWPRVYFAADGQTLLAAGGSAVTGYDVASGKKLFSWHKETVPDRWGVRTVVGGRAVDLESRRAWLGFTASPDGAMVAVTLDSGIDRQPQQDRIDLFDARTGKLVRHWSVSGKRSPSYERLSFSPDGQLLASSDGAGVHLWETATGKNIRSFSGHRGEITFLAFSRDGRRLGSASRDSTVLVWDVTGQAGELTTDAAVEAAWKDLLADDARRAHQAVWALARTPARAVRLLQSCLRPVKPVSREHLERLIRDLDSDQFTAREKATAELQQLGEAAGPAIRQALEGKPGLEQRRRLEALLRKLEGAVAEGEALRSSRAVRVLEYAGTPEARRLLQALAGGAEGARLTREAKAALGRAVARGAEP